MSMTAEEAAELEQLREANHQLTVQLQTAVYLSGSRIRDAEEYKRAVDCIADAFGDYCADNPDPDHHPVPWVAEAQEILGSARANEIHAARAHEIPDDEAEATSGRRIEDAVAYLAGSRVGAAMAVESSEVLRLRAALSKISSIRDSIIGLQTVNWSAHIYPLVETLNEAGFPGSCYTVARQESLTLLERLRVALAKLDEARINHATEWAEQSGVTKDQAIRILYEDDADHLLAKLTSDENEANERRRTMNDTTTPSTTLRIDLGRLGTITTGVFVHAIHPESEKVVTADVGDLTHESFCEWFNGNQARHEDFGVSMLAAMLGHGRVTQEGVEAPPPPGDGSVQRVQQKLVERANAGDAVLAHLASEVMKYSIDMLTHIGEEYRPACATVAMVLVSENGGSSEGQRKLWRKYQQEESPKVIAEVSKMLTDTPADA